MNFENPVKTPCVVLCRAWIDKMEGSRAWVKGSLEDGMELVFCEGKALFVRSRMSSKMFGKVENFGREKLWPDRESMLD